MSASVPENFQGIAVDKNWVHPKLVDFEHRKVLPNDVVIKNICCGICGSDCHTVKGNWVPLKRDDSVVGHEIVGTVVGLGDKVTQFKIGQRVGLGPLSNSCGECSRCKSHNENYCPKRVETYNSIDTFADNYVTQGGYASHSIGNENFVFAIPDKLESEVAAPLMCAGLTVFSPLVRNVGEDATGKVVGIIGIGGLGHLAIQFAKALGAEVYAFSRSDAKKEEAKKMGATDLIATSHGDEWITEYNGKFDFILNCASTLSTININAYLGLLNVNGTFINAGLGEASETFTLSPFLFLQNGAKIGGTAIGSKNEANLMLKIAAEKGVKPWIEKVQIGEEEVKEAMTRTDTGDVRYRLVLTGFDKVFHK